MGNYEPPDTERMDELYHLHANRHSQAVLAYFREASAEVASLSDIAEEISDYGGEEQARIQLHHYALPRLDAADIVDYDHRSNTVRYHDHPNVDLLEQSIERL